MRSDQSARRVPTRVAWSALLAFGLVVPASAAQTVVLPASACPQSDPLFADGFQNAVPIPSAPSNGSGGLYPGNITRTINVPSLGSRSYYLHVPGSYAPAQPWPLLLALRGTSANSQPAREAAAQQIRNNWASWADSAGFIVIAPVGNAGSNPNASGWGAPGDGAEISTALDDAIAHYNIEQSRIYLWGFSAGAHYGHDLALNHTDFFAAYGVSAGSLEAYACTDDGSYPPTCAALLAGAQPKIPVDIHLGNNDPLANPPYTAAGDAARFAAHGWVPNRTLHYTLFSGGHTYTVAQLGEIWNHLCPFALGP